MIFKGINNQEQILNNWKQMLDVNDGKDLANDTIRTSTAIVLENTQNAIDENHRTNSSRGLLCEAAGLGTVGALGPGSENNSYAVTSRGLDGNGDARVPSVVIPMLRRIYPQLLAHKLVGVQPMQAPIGMAFAFRAKYGRFGKGTAGVGDEVGYLNVDGAHTGKMQSVNKFSLAEDQGRVDLGPLPSGGYTDGKFDIAADSQNSEAMKCFFGEHGTTVYGGKVYGNVGDGADTSDAENWSVGTTMPEAGFSILKATVSAKTRKLGIQITRETEEDLKAMQGLDAQKEITDILSYEISQEIDRQLLGEIVQSTIAAGNQCVWNPTLADGRNQGERVNDLYTTILRKSANIATQNRRGAANWALCSPGAAALLESQIYNPLSVGGGLGNANAFGTTMDNAPSVTEIGFLRNGTIKLYRDTLAGGEYILLGYKGASVYDAGVIYLPYIPLEIMQALDPFTMNPITAARTRYAVTTNLFGAGQFYSFIGLPNLEANVSSDTSKQFTQG